MNFNKNAQAYAHFIKVVENYIAVKHIHGRVILQSSFLNTIGSILSNLLKVRKMFNCKVNLFLFFDWK